MEAEKYSIEMHNVPSHIRRWVGSFEFVTRCDREWVGVQKCQNYCDVICECSLHILRE